jgi:UDP-N-acetylmuramoyl-tripeptide--D-alanyl-D-alanine ligase
MDGAVPVVGITGSTGKTCTKDLTAAVLGRRARVVASPASFNNEIGLPLTILSTDESTEAVVCEMGARGVGHIRLLCEIARPRIGVVTNVGTAHLGVFGSLEALRDAKAELPEALPHDGTAVLNADDPVVASYAERTAAEVVWYGSRASIRAQSVDVSRSTGAVAFELHAPDGHAPVALRVPGAHMVMDALAAAAVGWSLGIPVDTVAAGLSSATVSRGRMEVMEAPDGLRILNDSYNANPASMAAAVRAARWMAGEGRFVAVLGPMAELGPIADEEHVRVGELLVRTGVDALVAVGEDARRIAAGAEREGLEPERIVRTEDPGDAARAARSFAGPGDLVLVKGSRVAGLERVVEALAAGDARAAGDPARDGAAP